MFARGPAMRLSLLTDYALRTLLYLGAHSRRATVREVAEFYGISADHVAKAVNLLARLDYLRSIRGVGGGIELGRAPETIRLGELIVALEGNLHLLECVSHGGVCAIETFCKLKGVLARAERVQRDYLDSVTLRDLLAPAAEMTPRSLPMTEVVVHVPLAGGSVDATQDAGAPGRAGGAAGGGGPGAE